MTYDTHNRTPLIPATQYAGERKAKVDLIEAFIGMASDITRPARIRWRLDDAAKGRSCKPLGPFPEVADACLQDGASFARVTKPLHVELARLRNICNRAGAPLTDALLTEAREEGEKNVAEQELSFCISNPSRSTLERYLKEAREYSDALQAAIQSAEDALCRCTK